MNSLKVPHIHNTRGFFVAKSFQCPAVMGDPQSAPCSGGYYSCLWPLRCLPHLGNEEMRMFCVRARDLSQAEQRLWPSRALSALTMLRGGSWMGGLRLCCYLCHRFASRCEGPDMCLADNRFSFMSFIVILMM